MLECLLSRGRCLRTLGARLALDFFNARLRFGSYRLCTGGS